MLAVVITLWVLIAVLRRVYRYPALCLLVALAAWSELVGDWTGLLSYTGVLAVLAGLGWWQRRSWLVRVVWAELVSECRRIGIYALRWHRTMVFSDLAKKVDRKTYVPKLVRVRADGWRDRLTVRLLAGQAPVHSSTARRRWRTPSRLARVGTLTKQRAQRFSGRWRSWSPVSGAPFVLLIVDELADVVAYQPDRKLKERANAALASIVSQGRAPGVAVLGELQDPRKSVIDIRHLFSVRVALRLDEKGQTDMVLGDGVRERGAAAHEIDPTTPGVAWVKVDGRREPERVRAFSVTDSDLSRLVEFATGHDTDGVLSFDGTEAA